jgi:WD40 repeat protein
MMIVQRLTGDGLSEPVELRNSVNRQFRYRVGTAAFSPQGRYLLVGDDDWNGTLWDASDWTQLASTDHPQGRLRDLAWSGDGLLVLFAADDSHRAVLWDQSLVESRIRNQSLWGLHDSVTRDEIRSYSSLLHPGAVTAVAFLDRNANRLVTGCVDGYARVWRRAPGLTTTLLPHNPRRPELESTPNRDWVVRAVATHPWGQLAATAGFDGHVRLWDVRDGHPLATTLAHGSPVVSLAFTSDGRRLWSGAKDGRIRVWDVSAGTPVAELPHHGGVVSGLSVSLQEPLALAGGDGAARLWHLDSLRPAGLRISHAELAESVFTDISPAADRLLTAGEQGQARLWDRQGELLHELAHKMGVWTGRFSHDGNWVVTASRDHTARVWNAHTGEAFALFQHESDVFSADFLPGDHVVITGSASGAQLWDVALERKLGPACKHLSDIVDVASTPDGRTAVLAEWDGYGILWRIPQPVTGTPRDIMLQIQRKTGMKLNDQGGMETIDSHEWLRLPRPQDRP